MTNELPSGPKLISTGLIFIAVGVFLVWRFLKRIRRARRCTVPVSAVVTVRHRSIQPTIHGAGKLTTLAYDYNGRHYERMAEEANKLGDVGEHRDILVNPDDPEEFLANSRGSWMAAGIAGTVVGIALILAGLACIVTFIGVRMGISV
ncbi:MAG: DUF3592 domain-containing protein [Lachnospiraceae bacterium]|nr:DUF3592 domain-containing protein [Lachnospiraceae bacterium]